MPRRYTDVEIKPVAELRPGDVVIFHHVIDAVVITATAVAVTWDDGTESTWPVEGSPAVEVVATKEKGA